MTGTDRESGPLGGGQSSPHDGTCPIVRTLGHGQDGTGQWTEGLTPRSPGDELHVPATDRPSREDCDDEHDQEDSVDGHVSLSISASSSSSIFLAVLIASWMLALAYCPRPTMSIVLLAHLDSSTMLLPCVK